MGRGRVSVSKQGYKMTTVAAPGDAPDDQRAKFLQALRKSQDDTEAFVRDCHLTTIVIPVKIKGSLEDFVRNLFT
jgi:hypothetical protein